VGFATTVINEFFISVSEPFPLVATRVIVYVPAVLKHIFAGF